MDNERADIQEPEQDVAAGQAGDDSTMSEEAKQSTTAAPWGAPVETTDENTSGETEQESHYPHGL